MKITIIGTGFVGVVSASVFAKLGHQVIGLDIDEQKIASLQQGKVPFHEPGLEEILKEQLAKQNLQFTTNYQQACQNADIVIIAVGTPAKITGEADLKYVFSSIEKMDNYIKDDCIIAIKSTVPPDTLDKINLFLGKNINKKFHTAFLPEFLKEGSAVTDTLYPDRIVIGTKDEFAFEKLKELHEGLNAPIVHVSEKSASMIKYTANTYLALRITYINEIADLCEINGADIEEVIQGIGFDKRIGNHYWYPGLGYGGSCFPKDVGELASYSRKVNKSSNLINTINQINKYRIKKIFDNLDKKVTSFKDKKVAVLGLSFKPNTNDMREAPSTQVIPYLITAGATVKSYDPIAKWYEHQIQANKHEQKETIEEACLDADIIITLVEWPQINKFDFNKVRINNKQQWFFDTRNQFKPEIIKKIGFYYQGIGRS